MSTIVCTTFEKIILKHKIRTVKWKYNLLKLELLIEKRKYFFLNQLSISYINFSFFWLTFTCTWFGGGHLVFDFAKCCNYIPTCPSYSYWSPAISQLSLANFWHTSYKLLYYSSQKQCTCVHAVSEGVRIDQVVCFLLLTCHGQNRWCYPPVLLNSSRVFALFA